MKTRLYNIREFFWPLLEPESQKQKDESLKRESDFSFDSVLNKINDLNDENYLKDLRDTCREAYANEKERSQAVESKAALLLGAEGLIIALIINFGGAIKDNINLGPFWYLSMALVFISTVYFFMSAWHTLKALERRAYHGIGQSEIIPATDKDFKTYLKKLSAFYISHRVKNYEPINSKVNDMVMSQSYFKRGVISVFILSIVFACALTISPLSQQKAQQIDCTTKKA